MPPIENTIGENRTAKKEALSLPSHVREFIEQAEAVESAMRNRDAIAITQTRSHLKMFYGTLDETKQADILRFVQQEQAGMHIEQERSKVYKSLNGLLNGAVIGTRSLAKHLPRLTYNTVELIGTTIGGIAAGGWSAGRKTYKLFNQAA